MTRAVVLGAAAAAVALAGAGCGGAAQAGGGADDGAARQAVTRYFAALGSGDAHGACAQMTAPSREALAEVGAGALRVRRPSCDATLQRLLASPAGPRLRTFAHARITGTTGTGDAFAVRVAGVAAPVRVVHTGRAWRIESRPSLEPDKLAGGGREKGRAAEKAREAGRGVGTAGAG